MILIGLLGGGGIGQVHVHSIATNHYATLATASDTNSVAADTVAKETGGIFAFKKCK